MFGFECYCSLSGCDIYSEYTQGAALGYCNLEPFGLYSLDYFEKFPNYSVLRSTNILKDFSYQISFSCLLLRYTSTANKKHLNILPILSEIIKYFQFCNPFFNFQTLIGLFQF